MRGTFQLMKSINKTTILNKIRLSKQISRAEIAKETGITAPTVSSIVKELIEERLVKETQLGVSSGGRKPTMLQLNDNGYYVIGIDAGTRSVRGAICDILGNFIVRTEVDVPEIVDSNQYLAAMSKVIQTLLDQFEFTQEDIIGIGIAMHGVIDIEEGIVVHSSNTKLDHVPVREIIEEEYGFPVMLENNSRLLALGEYWFGDFGEIDRFLVVNVGLGLGSGLIENNQLVHGAHNLAGEIGHATISLNGSRCSCGNVGCLETFISGKAIARRAREVLDDATEEITAKHVYEQAIQGNQACREILIESADYLAIGLINYIHTVNPQVIVLGGGVMGSADILMPIIKNHLKERVLIHEAWENLVLTVGRVGEDATLLGAAALQLQTIFVE